MSVRSPQLVPDELAGFLSETIRLAPDAEGEVVATLVSRHCASRRDQAVLYVHGYCDYFFNAELAARFDAAGFDFYALDLRKYGRSLRPHQSPNYVRSLEEHFEEIDAAVERIRVRDGHRFVLLVGHSTGGLTSSLYAHARRDRETIDALALNSPFFDLNGSWFEEHVASQIGSVLGALLPDVELRMNLAPWYGHSLHKDYRGEWDYRLDWKPHLGFPVRAGFLRAVKIAQAKLQGGLQVTAPALVMHSAESSWPKQWSESIRRTDAVLDVADIARFSSCVGSDVTRAVVPGGIHDLFLSAKPARDLAYRELFQWIGARAHVLA